ncbi:hypothetical protein [Mycobacteroides abscessus]|uniref:hypothetical protein n=2 Tax=Mycobacteroides abscessus TaxID=36809 RepID=UPI00092CDCBD|nr:hypothetical protein [Mycobacteroides abscessus]SHQ50270.1 DNA segregation ATPase, FtsK/SpoIIIE family [Mycobacteroides abscessus subsp. abscessus]SKQ83628.1 DNA segregation ATPase, FtsK/SpoIIIE family [Mycobacteroides abscessus subsp. massiliense]SLC49885.1 DNA segregation ATPase, FtsK/SpoIIIE family [Mycobacteroides abscessus subsp. massiliense]
MQLVYVQNKRKAKAANMIAFGLGEVALAAFMTGAPMPGQLILGAVGAAAMGWVAHHLALTPDPVGPTDSSQPGAADVDPGIDLVLPSRLRNDPTIARVIEVCRGTLKDQVILDVDSVEFEGSGSERHVVIFGLKCVTAGGLAGTGLGSRAQNAVRNSVPAPPGAAAWKMTPDVKKDFLKFSGVKDIADKVYPPRWTVVSSREEAGVAGRTLAWQLGIAADGPVELPLNKFPHGVVFSPTGGGKSIFVKSGAIEPIRSAGGIILLGDGKGTDYITYRNAPGVVAVGSGGEGGNGMYYYATVEIAHRIMNTRRKLGASKKLESPDTWEDVPAVLLVLDELKSMLGVWDGSTELDPDEKRLVQKRVDEIGALGRQPRVHMLMATQDLYDASIRGSWLNNAGLRVCLAKPSIREVKKGFEPSIQPEVLRVAAGFDDAIRGRGMVAAYDNDSGTTAIKEFQGYYGYSPGEPFPADPQGRSEWDGFKAAVSDKVPRLHPRMWFRLDEPSLRQQEIEEKPGAKPLGYIDFELFKPSEISELELINLDRWDEEKRTWQPDPAMVKFDPHPQNLEYVGHAPPGSGPTKLPQEM